MSDIKFACPECRQHIKCDRSHAGRKISCPSCKAELRIPRPSESSGKVPDAELLSPPARKSQPVKSAAATTPAPGQKAKTTGKLAPPSEKSPKLTVKPAASAPKPPAVAAPSGASAKAEEAVALHCICPVCQSELSVSPRASAASSQKPPPTAKLIRKGSLPEGQSPASKPPAAQAGAETGKGPAAATKVTKAQAARPGGVMKPRLDYILSGKPPSKEAYPSPKDSDEEEDSDKTPEK